MPVKRAMARGQAEAYPTVSRISSRSSGGVRRDAERVLDQLRRFFQVLFLGVVQAAEHGARIHLLADLDFEDHAHRRVDGVVLRVAAGADHGRGQADVLGVDGADKSRARRGDLSHAGGVGQQFEPVEHLRIAALRLDHFLELAVARAVEQLRCGQLARFVQGLGDLAEEDHAGRQFERKPGQVGRTGVLQRLRDLHDLERVADGVAQRLVHVGDQRLHALVDAAADADHQLRQAARIHLPLHERARADLDVEHQRVEAGRQLLRHDRGGDERNGFDRRRGVAQRVELAVGGREFVRLRR